MDAYEIFSECERILNECSIQQYVSGAELRIGVITKYEEIVCFYGDFHPIYEEHIIQLRSSGRWRVIDFEDIKGFNLEIYICEDA